mmetsp:Transcript_13467/g.23408  ORF Transcript_13467/g.23408 Transcript_13467/m.23408 type:complete len:113 (-) Transcript_13467:65-403(-)
MESGPDLRRNAAVPAPKAFSTAPKTLAMPRSAPMIAHLQGKEAAEALASKDNDVPLRENKSANPFNLARSGYGGTGSGVNRGVIAGAEYTRGPLQPPWAAQLAEMRRRSGGV